MKVNDDTIFVTLIVSVLVLMVLVYFLGVQSLASDLTLDCYENNQITLDNKVFYCIREDELNAD